MSEIDLGDPHWRFALGNYIHTICDGAVRDAVPELAQDLPGQLPWRIEARTHEEVLIISWSETAANRIDVVGDFEDARFDKLWRAIGSARNYGELSAIDELQNEFSWRSVLVAIGVASDRVQLAQIDAVIMDWLNDRPLAHAEDINRRRVERALPTPPRYDLDAIRNACWVVESASAMVQGTAFHLDGVGFVTCAHVVLDANGVMLGDLIAYRSQCPAERMTIEEVSANAELDLAVFRGNVSKEDALKASNDGDVPLNAHVAVCGFPNHRPSDTCSLSPGVVTAHRMRSGVRRLLTNAGIVAGMSGGPAIGQGGEVIGVCANGAAYIHETRDIEDQSIIPIAAVRLLDTSCFDASD